MFKAKKILAGAAALAVALTCTGCSDTSWGARAGDTEYRAGIYIYHAMNAYFDAESNMTETDTDVFAITIDDMSAKDWMMKETEKNLRNQAAIDQKYDELGLSLDEYSTAYADYMVEQMWSQYGEMLEGYGIGKESYRDVYLNSIKRDEIFMKYYDPEDGITPVSEEDIKAHLLDNYARVKYIQLNLKDAEGNLLKSEGKAEVMKMAEDYLSRAESGEDFDALIAEYKNYWDELTGANEQPEVETDEDGNIQGGGQIIAIEDAEGNTITLFDEENEVTVSESPANADSPEEETSVNDEAEETTVPETEADEDESETETDEDENADEDEDTDEDEESETAETTAPESETEPVSSDNTEAADETEAAEDALADSEEEKTEDAEAVNNEKVIKKGDYSPSKNVNDAIFDTMKDGEYKIIEDGEYYYLVYRMELFSDETYYDNNKNAALYEMKEEEFAAMLDSLAQSLSLTINDAAVKRYKFEKFAEA